MNLFHLLSEEQANINLKLKKNISTVFDLSYS